MATDRSKGTTKKSAPRTSERKPAARRRTGATPRRAAPRAPRRTAPATGPSWESRFWTANYPPGVPATFDYPVVPLTQFLDDAARMFPNSPAMDFMGNRWTYGELKQKVDAFAGALRT